MSGSHRTSARGVARRRTTFAAGAAVASAAIAFAPVAQASPATEVDAVQAAENGYVTWENLIRIAKGASTAQDSVLGVAAKPLPKGWVPTSTTTGGTTVTKVDYLTALGQAATMVVTPVNTSGIPGIPGLAQAGTLPAQLLLGEPLVQPGVDGITAAGKITAAWGALNAINVATVGQNTVIVPAEALGGKIKITQKAGELTGIPSLGGALALLPSGTRTTTNWSNTVAWPLLQAGGTTWMINDRLDVAGVNSQQIKDALGKNLNAPSALIVEKGTSKFDWGCLCNKFTPTIGADGKPVTVVKYDPKTAIPGALNIVDGIDIPGFSVINKGAGGNYFLPGDGTIGWLGQTTQVIVPAHGTTPAKVATVPIVAGGFAAPFQLLTAGGLYTPGIVTQSGQSLNAALGSRSFGLAIPRAGLGLQSTSFLESWHVGPDGVNVNTGWTVLLPQTGATGIPPIPLIYSMGAYNFGPNGFGFSGPSLFGVGLPSFQVGTKPAAGGASGSIGDAIGGFQIPTTLIPLDPKYLFGLAGITDPTGLGLTDPFGTAGKLLTPLYEGVVTPIAKPVTEGAFDLGSQAVNAGGKHAAEGVGNVADIVERVSGGVKDTADKVDPVVPEAPKTPLDDVSVKPVADAVDKTADKVQDTVDKATEKATEKAADTVGDTAAKAGDETADSAQDAA